MTDYVSIGSNGPGNALLESARQLLERLSRPARDVRFLRTEERRLAITVLLAALVPADRKIRDVEIDRLIKISVEQYKVPTPAVNIICNIAQAKSFASAELESYAALVPEILNIEDRCILIGMLWEIALCDKELHILEEEAIHVIAKKMGVPHKKTLEQHARAASRT
ncbi:MAG: TerB family tellurite resistance protein [Alphaproteobacteria bacterium]|nr:TerB family tellurite resistance protein [Alphaproteobacteria bacterium]